MTGDERARLVSRRRWLRLMVGVAATAATIVAGVAVGYLSRSTAGAGVAAAAVAVAVGGFFAPCSFPILVNVMLATSEKGRSPQRYAAGFAAGVGAFYVVAGALAVVLGSTLAALVGVGTTGAAALRLGAGMVLVLVGLAQLRVVTIRLPGVTRGRLARPSSHGFLYLLAGFG